MLLNKEADRTISHWHHQCFAIIEISPMFGVTLKVNLVVMFHFHVQLSFCFVLFFSSVFDSLIHHSQETV